jgi:hypothetical protein
MPESIRSWRAFNEKKPYIIATVFTVVAMVAVTGLLYQQLKNLKASKLLEIQPQLDSARQNDTKFTSANSEFQKANNELGQIGGLISDRYYWVEVLPEIRRVLTNTEVAVHKKWNTDSGVWIEQFVTPMPQVPSTTGAGPESGNVSSIIQSIVQKYNLTATDQAAAAAQTGTSDLANSIVMVCRAIKGPTDSANQELAYEFMDSLKTNSLVDAKTAQLGQGLKIEQYTFTFAVKFAPKNPLKL